MGEPLPIKLYETLVNLLGMYTYPHEEVLVLEAVANGIDAGAKKIEITFEKNIDQKYIIFHNDGPPMNKEDFENYHTISLSSKTRGKSIGFAGVGAKIFLASPRGSEIITTTGKEPNVFVSKMYRQGKDVEYETSLKQPISEIIGTKKIKHNFGTSYKVKITEKGYDFLKNKITEILQFWFNYAITSKSLILTINGKVVSPWEPTGEKFKKIIQFKKEKIRCYFWISEEEIPEESRHLVYFVYGKRIRADPVDFAYQIKGDMNKKVYCLADVTLMAEYLTSNKEDFKKNYFTNGARGAVKKAFYEFLKEQKLLSTETGDRERSDYVVNELTKRLDAILQNKDFKFLNPFSSPRSHLISLQNEDGEQKIELIEGMQNVSGTRGEGQGGDGVPTGGDEEGLGYSKSDAGPETGETRERKSRGLYIIEASFPDDPRESWVDPANRGLVYNSGHPFNKHFEKSSLFDYNLTRVCISALIKYKNEEVEWDSSTTLEYFENILHQVYQV